MGNPRQIRPDEVEIVVTRELRKAGVGLSSVRVLSRRALAANDATGYVMELAGMTSSGGASGAASRAVLIEFRNELPDVDITAIRALGARMPAVPEADGPRRLQPIEPSPSAAPVVSPLRVMVSTAGFGVEAAREARALGVMLLRIADGPAAFLRSQWAMGGQPPAWVPEYMAELVDIGPTGDVRYQMITGTR